MKVLITAARFLLGGTETYTVTVAEHLERLGHAVTLHAREASDLGRELAASRTLRLEVGETPEPDGFDALIAQDAAGAYELTARGGPPVVHVIHGLITYEQPPAGLQPPPTTVAMNDRIARRVLMLSNRPSGARLRILQRVCGEMGLELTSLGASGKPTLAPQEAMAEADIVVGYGRSVLEGMAMGCAAYVWDHAGGDGWVTPESYPALEADGFSGAATDAVIDADRLRDDFAAYRSDLGDFGFDLVRKHHSAEQHAEALVGLLEGAEPPRRPELLETLALLVRLETRAVIRADGLRYENGDMRRRFDAERHRLAEQLEEQRLRAEDAERRLEGVLSSRSWKLTAPLRRLGPALRRRRD